MFVDVTWGSAGSTQRESLSIASYCVNELGLDVLMHLTLNGLSRDEIRKALQAAKDVGVQNILALRGDQKFGGEFSINPDGGFRYAAELVRFIKEEFGDWFGIAVGGFPEGHADGSGVDSDLMFLKAKVDAGADFILTQFFYDVDCFKTYVTKCREAGITCPIIPGLMPIQSYSSFTRMVSYCNSAVPTSIYDRLMPVKDDDEAIKVEGVQIAIEMARSLLDEGWCEGLHFYTLNLERSVRSIMKGLGLGEGKGGSRELPWSKDGGGEKRELEECVRPINWANRKESYLKRTEEWDNYPNGRWGDARSPAFGELSQSHYSFRKNFGSSDERRVIWGDCPVVNKDVYDVFAGYILGSVPALPWCEVSLASESMSIQNELAAINRSGFLTINSQPAVNGLPSTDATFGWGGEGGLVYQKAYVECFLSRANLDKLVDVVLTLPHLNLYSVDNSGRQVRVLNGKTGEDLEDGGGTTALTWGVFPRREIIQPTIFDPDTFLVWSEEAFGLWSVWMETYDDASESYELIESIRDEFYLVALVSDDFSSGKEGIFSELLKIAKN